MIAPSPAPSPSPSTSTATFLTQLTPPPPSKLPVDFSPPLIAMVVVVATAFVVITYSRLISRHVITLHRRWRRWNRRRRLLRSTTDLESVGGGTGGEGPYDLASDGFQVASPYGLDESVIKTIPLSLWKSLQRDGGIVAVQAECAVCLLEFQEDEHVRTLPVCTHSFHVDCIDIWLRSHANCPLCRANVLPECPIFIPAMAGRIRPNFDDMMIFETTTVLDTLPEVARSPRQNDTETVGEITVERSPRRDFLFKRSYSFGFERSLGSDRLVLEPVTTSPWRYRRNGGGGGFWNKRPSPFAKSRVFSFRYYRGMKSPFFRRRSGGGGGFFPLSESSSRYVGGSSSRRSKSFASPMFMRSAVGPFSSSRLRSGDPEALLSPERFNRR